MKTTTNTIKFPSTAKFFAYVVLISGLAFLSCMVTNAQVNYTTGISTFLAEVSDSYADVLKSDVEVSRINMDQVWAARLERALVPEAEEGIEVEAWMLDTEYTAEAYEETVELEDWMLDQEYFFSADVYEEAIELEDWMLDADYFIRGGDNEEPIELEDWMLE
jgi:hypothetical protein